MVKKRFITMLIVGVIIISIVIIYIYQENYRINKDFVRMGFLYESIDEERGYVFTNYKDYYNKFRSNKLKEKDFDNNNYVLVSIQYDSCGESNIRPTDYTIKNDRINITVKFEVSCGSCVGDYMNYLLKVDKNITTANVNIKYKAINHPHCDYNISYKPIIYLYPEYKTDVTVKLGFPEKLTTTYPKYNNEWKVTAYPNGDLTDNKNTYYGLYWEGLNSLNPKFEDGFVVKGEETIQFLEEKLTTLGLNSKERNEFIIYWLPILEKNKYNLIRFETIENINKDMPLDISPNPDTLIRVLMEFKPIDKKVHIKNQTLSSPTRKGFTVVEWGGSEIK